MAGGEYKISLGVDIKVSDIRDRIKKFNENKNNAKLRVGVKLKTDDIAEQIKKIKPKTPIDIDVRLNDEGVLSQIANIRQQLQELEKVSINLGFNNGIINRNGNIGGETTSGVRVGKNKNNDTFVQSSSSMQGVAQEFREVDVNIDTVEGNLERLKSALKSVGFSDSSVENIAKDFERIGIAVNKITSKLNKDGSIKLTIKGIDELDNVVTVMRTIGTDGAISEPIINFSQPVKEAEANFKRLKELAKELRQIYIDIELNFDESKFNELREKFANLSIEYDELFDKSLLSNEQKEELELEKNAKALEELEKIRKDRAARAEEIKIKISVTGDDFNKIEKMKDKAKGLSTISDDLSRDLTRLNDLTDVLQNTPVDSVENVKKIIATYKELEQVMNRVGNQIAAQKREEDRDYGNQKLEDRKKLLSTGIDTWLQKNTAAAEKFGDELRELQRQIDACGDSRQLDHLESEIKDVYKRADALDFKSKSFGDRLKDQFSKYAQYFSVAEVFMYIEQGLRDMFEQVTLIDSAMTELRKVTNETDATYNQFLKNAATKSKEIGTTIDGFIGSTADFARLGYGFEESQNLAEVANIYAVVGDEIDGVEGATQSLVSTLAAFRDETSGISDDDFAMQIIDKFNEVSNNFAISSGGIGEAMERSASSLRAANNTIDESIAMITAANTVVQNPEKVGNGYADLKNGYIG